MRKIYQPKQAIQQLVLSSVLILSFAAAASAYTVVMRGGKRIEIPSKFLVTNTTLTYEAGPGIQITLELAAIDIPATEKANNETAGALLRRVGAVSEESTAQNQGEVKKIPPSQVRRTITNRDLDASTVRRRQESYWRARASALRTEIAAIDAELNYLRVRLEDSPSPLSSGFTSISVAPFIAPGISFGNAGIGHPFPRVGMPGQLPVYGAPQFGPQLAPRIGFGGGDTRGQVLLNNGGFRHFGSLGVGFPFPIISTVGVFGSGIQPYDYSYERSALITHFNELATARAGLNARWRELEDEARRAGVPPSWLRP